MTIRQTGRWTLTLIGLALCYALPLLPRWTWAPVASEFGTFWAEELLWPAAGLLVVLYVVTVERRPLSSIGFRTPGGWDIGWGVIFGVLMIVGSGAISALLLPALHLHTNMAVYNGLVDRPVWQRVVLVTRAAVCEEIMFRGYPLQRLEEWSGSTWAAALVSLAVFTYAHLSGWGAVQLITAGFGGIMLTILFVWKRNLWSNMLAHWIVDGVGFVLMPMLMAHH